MLGSVLSTLQLLPHFTEEDTEGQRSYYVASKVTQPVIELGFPPRRLALERVLLLTMSYYCAVTSVGWMPPRGKRKDKVIVRIE